MGTEQTQQQKEVSGTHHESPVTILSGGKMCFYMGNSCKLLYSYSIIFLHNIEPEEFEELLIEHSYTVIDLQAIFRKEKYNDFCHLFIMR